ncbi:Acetyltransferase (GNAT) domain-containing protein [Chitinophaga costaii]|uniref:Acetyltransferase (GNAT) domain-containing protein n=1 Tax=Chitinophaga costaii TaxID=1335309 RepID=A0A1C4DVB3_9BACT|nr:GNAT family N-acetyltransferase [Chitinophaga costaii]PUZ27816.1 GNAT family N-acetyltransferase [Chitinophaga costaii]SCC35293.1 Acetyltransferase (GNAT) domain-containing protein [Chitinophaga costaii]
MFSFRVLVYGSKAYQDMVSLRDRVLRKPLGLSFSREYLAKEKDDILIGSFTTTQPEQLVGCCILTPVDVRTVQLRQMAVSPDYQQQGIGSEIVKYAEALATEAGYSTLMMHARATAIHFYTKLGYKTIGATFEEVGIPHVEMQKIL